MSVFRESLLELLSDAQCLADLKACRQSNISVYSFKEHQRFENQSKYLYGANVIIGAVLLCLDINRSDSGLTAEGIMVLNDPNLRALYDLKACDEDQPT